MSEELVITAEGNLIRMAMLRERIHVKEGEADKARVELRNMKSAYDSLERNARAEFLRRHMQDGPDADLPDNVSVRDRSSWDYDDASILSVALAEGVEEVINHPPPKLRKSVFNKMLDDGEVDPEVYGVKRKTKHVVYIREEALLRAYIQGTRAAERNIDIDTGEVVK